MKNTFIIVFLFICNISISQIIDLSSNCDGEVHVINGLSKRKENISYSDFIENYIDSISPELNKYIEKNKDNLVFINPLRCNANEILFREEFKNKITCKIDIVSQNYKISDTSSCKLLPLLAIMSEEKRKKFIGLVKGDFNFRYRTIKSIRIRIEDEIINLDSSYFESLINPNTCFTESYIKPISLYYSQSKNVFYLYIYGQANYKYSNYERFVDSYVHKIIFDKKGVIGTMTIPGYVLCRYAWYECPDFLPF